ncbi:glycoside hydrolase family 3 protein [Rhizomonospora bruguierae]|uniref:glycoside hydrolase family 3 protein n=1 Tax=Rhizomonospora bruguierae TaxID=1581705 RepID=UPI001BCDE29B|nr:glycoside hydrolase family 3 protein [Micromonospora sp. NBRC 107566]
MAGVSPPARRLRAGIAAGALLAVAACSSGAREPAPTTPTAPPTAAPSSVGAGDPAARAAELVARLGDEDLVGQVLMPYAYGSSATRVSGGSAAGNRKLAGVDTPAQMVAKYRLGGLILVGFSADDPTAGTNKTTNVDRPPQVRDLTDGLQTAARELPAGGAPMLIATDQEFGVVTRIGSGVTTLPSAMAFGAAGDPAGTQAAWGAAGAELAAMGVNVDFAPVADVLGGGGSAVIGSRSYGSDPSLAAQQVAGAVRGLSGAGVAATLKHFPGHGHTTGDSHDSLPAVPGNLDQLTSRDLPPFAAGIAAGADLVMSGHLDLREVDPGTPATFSHRIVTDILRGQLKFTGVVVTDAMNMAPAMRWPPGEAAVRALNAGNDLLLMPPDLPAARDGLLAGLRDGSLPRSRLVAAATRVLTLRFKLGQRQQPALSTLNSAAHAEAAAAVARRAVTLLRGSCGEPLVSGAVTVTAGKNWERPAAWLAEELRRAGVPVVRQGGAVVHLVGYRDDGGDLRGDARVTVAMDTPYVLASARSPVLVATYSSARASMAALAAVLAGRERPAGRSPVQVGNLPRTACAA